MATKSQTDKAEGAPAPEDTLPDPAVDTATTEGTDPSPDVDHSADDMPELPSTGPNPDLCCEPGSPVMTPRQQAALSICNGLLAQPRYATALREEREMDYLVLRAYVLADKLLTYAD